MKIICFILLAICLSCAAAFAQRENDVWVYGDKSGLDFSSGSPVYIKTAAAGHEGTASISDTFGRLLFYADGENVFDNTHARMPESKDLISNISSTLGTVIVPIEDDQYYIFGVESIGVNQSHFFYHLVDMKLNGGKGDIVKTRKNIILADSMSEKILVAPTCDGIWVILHHLVKPEFYAYKIRPSGMIDAPVASVTTESTPITMYRYGVGGMAISNNYKRIAMVYYETAYYLFDFDSRSGKINSEPILKCPGNYYNIVFSNDDSKLYTTLNDVTQYDLSLLPDTAAVVASGYTLAHHDPRFGFDSLYYGIRLGPDKKLYMVNAGPPSYTACINYPDKAGAACDLSLRIPALDHVTSNWFLQLGNNTVRLPKPKVNIFRDSICDKSVEVMSTAYADSFKWNDGSYAGERSIDKAGRYWRQSYKNYCLAQTDTYLIAQRPFDTTAHVYDTSICFRTAIILSGAQDMSSFLWQDGDHSREQTIDHDGTYWVCSRNDQCKTHLDTFRVSFVNFDLHIADTVVCEGQPLMITPVQVPEAQYRWGDGSTQSIFRTGIPGQYWLNVSLDNCSKSDTFTISGVFLETDLGKDTILCAGETLTLSGVDTAVAYLWNTGDQGKSLTVTTSGTYYVTISKDVCTFRDTVNVTFKRCDDCIAIPNAFTPNGDNRNDRFAPLLSCPVQQYSFAVFNRYGQEVFHSGNAAEQWDGTFNGVVEDLGTYYYLLKVTFDYPGAEPELYKGDLTLIR